MTLWLPEPLESSIIHVADIHGNCLSVPSAIAAEVIVPPLKAKAWEALALLADVIEPTLAQTERLVNETIKDFLYE